MTRSKRVNRILAAMAAILSVGLLAVGIGLTVGFQLMRNPPPAIPGSSSPTTAPKPHEHCRLAHTGRTVPQHRVRIRPKDHNGFALTLQEFAHRHGGCVRSVYGNDYMVSLPQEPMRQILELDRHNYAQWSAAVVKTPTTVPAGGAPELRQLNLYLNDAAYAPQWMFLAGVYAIGYGILACFGALIVCVETFGGQTRRTRPTETVPLGASSPPPFS